jgi:hypothetical protein
MAGRIIQSRYASECVACRTGIAIGSQIEYVKGEGARHVQCIGQPIAPKVYARRQATFTRWVADWVFKVVDPVSALGLEGEEIIVIKRSGEEEVRVLGNFISSDDPHVALYMPGLPFNVRALEPGVYENEHGIFIVKKNAAKTSLYAKKLIEINGVRKVESGDHVQIEFEYDRNAIALIKPEHKMDFERAKELTIRYGRCINCGRKLKDAKSVERGIGPVCAKSFSRGLVAA